MKTKLFYLRTDIFTGQRPHIATKQNILKNKRYPPFEQNAVVTGKFGFVPGMDAACSAKIARLEVRTLLFVKVYFKKIYSSLSYTNFHGLAE